LLSIALLVASLLPAEVVSGPSCTGGGSGCGAAGSRGGLAAGSSFVPRLTISAGNI